MLKKPDLKKIITVKFNSYKFSDVKHSLRKKKKKKPVFLKRKKTYKSFFHKKRFNRKQFYVQKMKFSYFETLSAVPLYFSSDASFYSNYCLKLNINLISKRLLLANSLYYKNYSQKSINSLFFFNRSGLFYKHNLSHIKNNKYYFLCFDDYWSHFFGRFMAKKLYSILLKKRNRKRFFFNKQNLFYSSYYKSKKKSYVVLKNRRKKKRENLFFYYKRSKQNKSLLKYYSFRFFFSNYSLRNLFRKNLFFYQFVTKLFFYKRKKYLKNNLIRFKYLKSNKSYISLYNFLNKRLVNFLFNKKLLKPLNLLKTKFILVNGIKVSFKNYLLKSSDIIHFLDNRKFKSNLLYYLLFQNKFNNLDKDLFSEFFYYNKKMRLKNYFTYKLYNKFLPLVKVNSDYFFNNTFYIGKQFFFNSFISRSMFFNYLIFPKKFFFKIFKKIRYFKKIYYFQFKNLYKKKNKFFKLKYLMRNRVLNKMLIKKLFKKYKYGFKYRWDANNVKMFFRKLRIYNLQKNRKSSKLFNEKLYRHLKNPY